MYTKGTTEETDEYSVVTYRNMDEWPSFGDSFHANFVLVGDEHNGPMMGLTHYSPQGMEPGPTHCHAQDTLRLVIKGAHHTGRKAYQPGEFRFQKGWVPYANEAWSEDHDDTWVVILGGDRRGSRARLVDPVLAAGETDQMFRHMTRELTKSFNIEVDDWLSDEPEHTAGPSAMVTTLGPLSNSGKLDGSFDDTEGWQAVGPHTRAVVALYGPPTSGPAVVLAATEAGQVAAARSRFAGETVRMVVRGSCTIGGETYLPGDIRVQHPGKWWDEVVAGPDGLDELFFVADRREAEATVDDRTPEAWPAALGTIAGELAQRLPEPAAA